MPESTTPASNPITGLATRLVTSLAGQLLGTISGAVVPILGPAAAKLIADNMPRLLAKATDLIREFGEVGGMPPEELEQKAKDALARSGDPNYVTDAYAKAGIPPVLGQRPPIAAPTEPAKPPVPQPPAPPLVQPPVTQPPAPKPPEPTPEPKPEPPAPPVEPTPIPQPPRPPADPGYRVLRKYPSIADEGLLARGFKVTDWFCHDKDFGQRNRPTGVWAVVSDADVQGGNVPEDVIPDHQLG